MPGSSKTTGAAPKGRNVVKRTLADGTVKEYVYDRRRKRKNDAPEVKTVAWLISLYLTSAPFQKLRPASQKIYRIALDHARGALGKIPVADLARSDLMRVADKLASRPGLSRMVTGCVSALMKFALDRGYRKDFNPAAGISKPALQTRKSWSDDEVDALLAAAPREIAFAAELALGTGQRRGDILTMTWAAYDGAGLSLVQRKTGIALYIPLSKRLRSMLDAAKSESARLPTPATTIVTSRSGRPYTESGFEAVWRESLRRAGLTGKGLTFHGLRHTAAVKLAEAGCTVHEIAAITGHQTLSLVQHYTKQAEQKRLAQAAQARREGQNVVELGKTRKTRSK